MSFAVLYYGYFFFFRARNVIFVPMQMQVQQDTLPRSGLWVSLAEGHCSL